MKVMNTTETIANSTAAAPDSSRVSLARFIRGLT
jgi:hypothetical protein